MTKGLGRVGSVVLLVAAWIAPAAADHIDVPNLFASVCGFCHEDGGRKAGEGPRLMNSERSDEYIRDRIRNGRRGRMPAFGKMFPEEDLDEIVAYIRALKSREEASAQSTGNSFRPSPRRWPVSRSSRAPCRHGPSRTSNAANALPFAGRKGEPRGIQLDLARVIAERLGVRLSVDWVILSYQMKRADCDIVMGTIADREALKDSRLKVSRPCFRSGVVLAVRRKSTASPASRIRSRPTASA